MQVWVVDAVEDGRGFVECALHGPFGIDALVTDDRRGAPDENRVVEHQQLCIEDSGQIGPARGGDATANLLELSPRSLTRPLEGGQLTRHPVRTDRKAEHLRPLNCDQCRTHRDARRYADAVQAFPDSSPNPDSTSSTRASTARSSSGPSAITVSVVPREAASNRIPMMLFPSMTFDSRPTRIRDSNRVARWTNLAAARAWSPSWFTTVTDRVVNS